MRHTLSVTNPALWRERPSRWNLLISVFICSRDFQLWEERDYNHRLHPEKLLKIIELSEQMFNFDDLEIEVEYQGKDTIGKYGLDFDGTNFLLTSKVTACLALDACGIPKQKPRIRISELGQTSCCDPASGCC